MNNNFNKMMEEILSNMDKMDDGIDFGNKLEEIGNIYDFDKFEKEIELEEKANYYLEKAENAKTVKTAIKYAKKAYETSPKCFEAVILLSELETNIDKKIKILDDGLTKEKKRLIKEGYYCKDNIGKFFSIFETRDYIIGMFTKIDYLINNNNYKDAIKLAKDIIRLNSDDNMGARYYLIAIYSYLNKEEEMLKIYKKYNEESLELLFPIFIYYFNKKEYKKANTYFEIIKKENPYIIDYFKGTIKNNSSIPNGSYIIGDPSEVIMYFEHFNFLIDDNPNIKEYINNK